METKKQRVGEANPDYLKNKRFENKAATFQIAGIIN